MKNRIALAFAVLLILFVVSPANAITLPFNICTNTSLFTCPGTPGLFIPLGSSVQAPFTTSFFEDGTCTPSCNFNASQGDVLLNDGGAGTMVIGDLLRFNGNSATLFSDNSDGVDSFADTNGIPTPNPNSQVTIDESSTGPTTYTIVDVLGTPIAVYTINSDPVETTAGVPEPGTVSLVLAGGVLLFAKLRRKRV